MNFKDSERDSVISYLEDDEAVELEPLNAADKRGFFTQNLVDTPTRIVNFSNDFLPRKKRIAPEKLKEKKVQQMRHFSDLEALSDVENSQKSTGRKHDDEQKNVLFKIIGDAAQIKEMQDGIRKEIEAGSRRSAQQAPMRHMNVSSTGGMAAGSRQDSVQKHRKFVDVGQGVAKNRAASRGNH